MSPSAAIGSRSSTTTSETVSAESLGQQLRAALPPVRLHSVSLYNAEGDVLWLSEGALGPDEHSVVLDAIQTLHQQSDRSYHESGLEDGRFGMFLPVRAPHGRLVGIAMLLSDLKTLPDGIGEQLANAKVRAILQRIAVFLRVESTQGGDTASTAIMKAGAIPVPPAETTLAESIVTDATLSGDFLTLELMDDSLEATTIAPATALAGARAPSVAARTAPTTAPVRAPATARAPALAATPAADADSAQDVANDLALSVQELVKLRSQGRTRRYEVLARSRRDASRNQVPDAFLATSASGKAGAVLDDLVLQQLFTWLGSNPQIWEGDPASFSINLSIGSLESTGFLDGVEAALKTAGIPAASIGFEITEFACVQCKPQVQRFLARCEKLGCFVVLDNFSFDSAALPLLASKAVRMVKMDPKLTAAAMREKLAQAVVIAISQACKVLGIHCIAKKVDSQAALDWLEAIGCDFAQGYALEMPLSLDSLAAPSPTLPRGRGKEGKSRR